MKNIKRKSKPARTGPRATVGSIKTIPSGPFWSARPCGSAREISRSLLPVRFVYRVHPGMGPEAKIKRSESGSLVMVFNWDLQRKVIENALYN